jgi:hypothetical protein
MKGYCVNQLSITAINTWYNQLIKIKYLFKLKDLEVSVHDQLVKLPCAKRKTVHHGSKCIMEQNWSHLLEVKKRKRTGSHISFKDTTPKTWRPFTKVNLLKFLSPQCNLSYWAGFQLITLWGAQQVQIITKLLLVNLPCIYLWIYLSVYIWLLCDSWHFTLW